MPTYDYTQGVQAQSVTMYAYSGAHSVFVVKRRFDVATVIAWNTTLTTDAKITSGDIFKVIPVADDTWVTHGGLKVITALGSCTSLDFGTAGGVEILSAVNPGAGVAGAHSIMLVSATWGSDNLQGYTFTVADTLDIQFNADEVSGTLLMYAVVADVGSDVADE